jgi:outer membrane protein assembly factor BamE (lipoprotein component of BamABCDE complex)
MRHRLRAAIAALSIVALVVGCAGCTPRVVREKIAEGQVISATFAERMSSGLTTRDQEQEFIRASTERFSALRRATE